MRFLRRRGLGVVCKTVLAMSLVVLFVQITSSHPKGIRENRVKQNQFYGDETVVDQMKKLAANADSAVQKPNGDSAAARPKRDKEFYQNVVVHFDLKGAPPKVSYFVQLLKLIAKSGATGILLEWEDMFPWSGPLETIRGTDAYSMQDVKTILSTAKSVGLDVIPLVQTFGHLEWILKYEEFRKFREADAFPQVICLGDEEGLEVIKEAVKQVIDAHKEFGIPYFHIGADEAFQFGRCKAATDWLKKNSASVGGPQLLALTHLKNIAQFVKQQIGAPTTVLAWHDMLKSFDLRLIKDLGLGRLVEPVIWDYSENIVTMNDMSFSSLAENFPVVWASSAYKGANFPSAKYIDVRHYETNNKAWIKTKQQQERKFDKFHGIIVTGWQRYDHMSGLCEILPMGLPSMILQIQTALAGANQNQPEIRQKAAQLLGCSSYTVAGLNLISRNCDFPGFGVYQAFQGQAQDLIARINDEFEKNHMMMGWLSPYTLKHDMSQNWYLNQISPIIEDFKRQMDQVENKIRQEMKPLFFENTIDEFIFLTIGEISHRLHFLSKEIARIQPIRTWPKRHFPIKNRDEL